MEPGFNKDARARISRAVRKSEGSAPGSRANAGETPRFNEDIIYAKAMEVIPAGHYGLFHAYRGTFGTKDKGSEAYTQDDDWYAFVQRGICVERGYYYLFWRAGGLEVMNPDMTFRGKPSADIAAGQTGGVNVYIGTPGSEVQPTAPYGIPSVRNDSSCTVKGSQICTCQYVNDNGLWQFINAKNS